MSIRTLIFDYLKALFKQWYVLAAAIFKAIGIVLLLTKGIQLKLWVYLSVFGIAFIIANFHIYCDNSLKINEISKEAERTISDLTLKIANLEDSRPKFDLFFDVSPDFLG